MIPTDTRGGDDRHVAIAGLVLAPLVLALYVLRVDEVVGSFVDDGWYVLLGKALATGHGFTIINAPTPGIRPLYPPGFPFLLSLVFRLAPRFPENLPALKGLSVAAMLGVGGLTWVHCRSVRGLPAILALGVALATVLHPAFVFLATATVLSECVFTFVQLAAVLVMERGVRRDDAGAGGWTLLTGGLLAGFAMLVRGFGIAVIAAGVVLLLREGRWRGAAWFFAGVLAVVGPWQVDGYLHPTTPAQQVEVNDYIVHGYASHFWRHSAGQSKSGDDTVSDLPDRIARCAHHILYVDGGALLVYPWYRQMEPGAMFPIPAWAQRASMLLVGLVAIGYALELRRRAGIAELVVGATVVLALLWPWVPFRFLLPLLPFLLCYLLRGVRALVGLVGYTPGVRVLAALLGVLAAVSLGGDLAYLHTLRGPPESRPAWNRGYQEQREVARWIEEHTAPDAIVEASLPAFVYLFSGRRTVGRWAVTLEAWRQMEVRYMALLDFSALPAPDNVLPWLVVYRTKPGNLRVIDISTLTAPPR